MKRNTPDPAEISALVGDEETRVKIGGFDVDGVLRGKSISIDKFRSACDSGFGFCDVIFGWDSSDALYDNAQFTGWHTGYPDVLARLDLSTFRRIPWEGGVPFVLADFHAPDGGPLPISPRQALRRVVETAEGRGYRPMMSCEFEFFFFKETPESLREKGYRNLTPLSPGMFGYSVYRASANAALVDDLVKHMKAFDCELEGIHTETGPGVYEVAIGYDDAVRAADKAMLFKTGAKEIAARHGLIACFMAKFSAGLPGCSGHSHQSLWDLEGKKNLFVAEGGSGASDLMKRYAAGQVATMRELLPFYLPTVNSYKRTVPGTWAPASATWGRENRTTALRFIEGPNPKATRIEFRLTGADIN
ncbi:MAG TPA: glutamine synthetase family protein, partial [Planctomycetota bacterium]|nr:glutamine synthetase family protein [Planctomycetota bacterium]